jgi:hypothetical protein
MLARNQWAEALTEFVKDRIDIDEVNAIRECLRWPLASPLDAEVVGWTRAALRSLRWRPAKGNAGVWRRPR